MTSDIPVVPTAEADPEHVLRDTSGAQGRRQQLMALEIVVALLLIAVGAIGLVARQTPHLAQRVAVSTLVEGSTAPGARASAPGSFSVAPSIRTPATRARVYALDRPTPGDVDRLRRALALSAPVEAARDAWLVRDRQRTLRVEDRVGGPWTLRSAPEEARCDMPACPQGSACVQMCRPPGGATDPTAAENAARAFFGAALPVGPAQPVSGLAEVDGWGVSWAPQLDGYATSGWEQHVVVGRDGVVVRGDGNVGIPRLIGEYPLVTIDEAVQRLGSARSGRGRVTAVQLVLRYDATADGAHLVPAYVLSLEDGTSATVVALADDDVEREPAATPLP